MNFKNIPYHADEKEAREIMDYLTRVSSTYGTKFELEEGKIVIK